MTNFTYFKHFFIQWAVSLTLLLSISYGLIAQSPDSWEQKSDVSFTVPNGPKGRLTAVGFAIGSKGYIGMGHSRAGFTNDFWEYDPATNSWTQKADFGGTSRFNAVGFSIGSKGYIGTGGGSGGSTNDFWEYDPVTNSWTQKADFGGTARQNAVGFSIGSKGYIGTGGGSGGSTNDFWEYDPATDKWTKKADFGGGERIYAVGFSIGSKGYIGTGLGAIDNTNDFWEYDPATDKWTKKADFGGEARSYAVGFSIGTKGYIGTGSHKKDFWEYDPATNSWTKKADFGGTGRYGAVGFSIGSKGYIGTGVDGNEYTNDFWEYDGSKWTKKANFGGTLRQDAVGFVIGSKGYIGTGSSANNAYKNDFWEYDPATNLWTQKADFGGGARHRAVGFGINGKGYIGTGVDGTGHKNDFWEYDPATNSWTQKADFGGVPRYYAVGFSIGSKGYIGTGAGSGGGSTNDFWEYDPATDKWIQKADFGGGERVAAVGFGIGSKGYLGTGVGGGFTNDFWEYDPVTDKWIKKADFGGSPRYKAVGFSIGSKGYIGTGDNFGYKNDFWEYDPVADKWTQKANVGGGGRVAAVGFGIGSKGYLGTGEYGDPRSDFWVYTSCTLSATITPAAAQSVCSGAALSLSGGGTGGTSPTYAWSSSPSGFNSSQQNPTFTLPVITSPTDYTLTLTLTEGSCTATTTKQITVNPTPNAVATQPTQTICSASAITPIALSGNVAGTVYSWSRDNTATVTGIVANGSGDISGTLTNTTNAPVTATFTITPTYVNAGTTCTGTAITATVTVDPVSAGGSIGGATTVCAGTNSSTLTLSEHTGNVIKWQSADNANFTNATDIANTTTQFTATNLTQTMYYRAVVKSGVCNAVNSASATVTVNPLPTATLSGTAVVCLNAPAAEITFSGSNGTAPYTFTYTRNNGTEQTLTTTDGNSATLPQSTAAAGTFVFSLLRVSDATGCGQDLSDRDTVTVLAPAVPTNPTAATISQGQSATLTANGCAGPGLTLLWYKSSDNSQVTMPVSPTATTSYYARCQQTEGQTSCLSGNSVSVTVTVGQRIFVNIANATPDPDGKSWATAFPSLQTALTAARNAHYLPLEVWVAKGTYLPGTLRKDVFEVPSGVKLYGGFVGSEDSLYKRNWKTNITILSGEIGTINKNDNVNHVVLFSATNDSTRLDGFTVRGGYAEFYAGNQNTDLNSPEVLSSGGGMLAINKSKGSITHCIFTDNRASAGGGIHLRDSSRVHITQSIIWGNEANFGGGLYVLGGSQPQLENVLVVNNKGLGGGLYVNQSQPTLINCTIASNKDEGNAAGGILNASAITTVKNSILWGNSSLQSNGGSLITYSIVEGGYAGTGNKNLNPQFVNPNSMGLAPMGSLGDYHLLPCSPGIDAADNAVAPLTDLEGNARPYSAGLAIADMGVYESQSSGTTGPNHLSITENITSGTALKTGTWIVASNQISNATVVYQAAKSVTLTPGFSATGTGFLAQIGGCP